MACDLAEPRGCPLIILDRSIQACSAARGRTRRVLLESQDRCPRKPPRKTQTRVERNSFCRLFASGPGCQVETIGSEEVSDAGRGFFSLKHTRGRILPLRSAAACRGMAPPAQRAPGGRLWVPRGPILPPLPNKPGQDVTLVCWADRAHLHGFAVGTAVITVRWLGWRDHLRPELPPQISSWLDPVTVPTP